MLEKKKVTGVGIQFMQVQKQGLLGSAEGRRGVGRRPALPRLQGGVTTEWTQL